MVLMEDMSRQGHSCLPLPEAVCYMEYCGVCSARYAIIYEVVYGAEYNVIGYVCYSMKGNLNC